MKFKFFFLFVSCILVLSFASFPLERKNVVNGALSMLVPKEFKQITKSEYQSSYAGDPKPEDYYSNENKSIEISFLKVPKQSDDLLWCKQFVNGAFMGSEATFYFNDIVRLDSTNVHLAKFDATFKGKKQYCTMFFINLEEYSLIGNLSCEIEFKEQWNETANEIFESIKINH